MWRDIGPLPKVHKSKRDKGLGFDALCDYYRAMDKEPLIVRALMGTPYVPAESTDGVHLDGLLSSAVLNSHPAAPKYEDACVVPLPIELAGVYSGKPLWTCSELRPIGEIVRDTEHWHKRYPDDRADLAERRRANTSAGRYREYRVPLSTVRAESLVTVCVGNAGDIERLLGYISHLGKKPSQGLGRVLRWSIEQWDADLEEAKEAALWARPVPSEYAEESGSRKAWTPPYWHAPYWSEAVTRG